MSAVRLSLQDLVDSHQPTWDDVRVLAGPGEVSETEYLDLETNRLVEYSDGAVEELPMPKPGHQLVSQYLHDALRDFTRAAGLGQVFSAPTPVQMRRGRYREPDVVFIRAEAWARSSRDYISSADLVIEVVTPGGRNRDLVQKRREYAEAGIPEYWIVERERERIVILVLDEPSYRQHGEFRRGSEAASATLAGFSVSVDAVLDAADV